MKTTKLNVRNAIWGFLYRTSGTIEGALLPRWLIFARWVLFPLETFYWHMSGHVGYSIDSDTWRIYGVTYSGLALQLLANAKGEIYRIDRSDDVVVLTRVEETGP